MLRRTRIRFNKPTTIPTSTCQRWISSSSISQSRWTRTELIDRSLISLTGPDASHFLQGLITNQIQNTTPPSTSTKTTSSATYTAFLNPKGRLLFDCFLYLDPLQSKDGTPSYLIDHHSSQSLLLWKWLTRFVLKSQVKLKFRSDQRIWALWDRGIQSSSSSTNDRFPLEVLGDLDLMSTAAVWKDVRGNGRLGYRVLVDQESESVLQKLGKVRCFFLL